MYKFSVLRPNLFLLVLFFFLITLIFPRENQAWNPDYAYELPKQRRLCLQREPNGSLFFYSVEPEEECPEGQSRYLVIFAKEPHGAMALLEIKTSQFFYPPLTLKWPPDETFTRNQIWHFTCVQAGEKEILGSKVTLYKYLGEMTANIQQDCLEAEGRALRYCQEQFKGEQLLETCPLTWGQ